MKILEELNWRGLLSACTDTEALTRRLENGPVTLYCGFDPTADSLHVGNLIPLLALRRFQRSGHFPIALAGGATGSIGDPSGKSAERQMLSREIIQHNIDRVKTQLSRLLDFESNTNPAKLVDNISWTEKVTYLEFLRDIGKHFTVNMMVAKESVRSRMEDRDNGISYTEFSYMLLQAFDFYKLHLSDNCELQIGGSDQWGNITAGTDLIRRKVGTQAFGLTLPLITNSDGSKFGKTAAGAVWLDPMKTSVYRFYQFWMRTDDKDAVRYLRFFTFLGEEEIKSLEAEHFLKPEQRKAQRSLAKEVTSMIHGHAATAEAIHASEVLFGGECKGINAETFNEIAAEVPTTPLKISRLTGDGVPMVEILVESGLCPSKGQARKDVEGGGIYLNNERVNEANCKLSANQLIHGRFALLRKGKRNYNLCIAELDTHES